MSNYKVCYHFYSKPRFLELIEGKKKKKNQKNCPALATSNFKQYNNVHYEKIIFILKKKS